MQSDCRFIEIGNVKGAPNEPNLLDRDSPPVRNRLHAFALNRSHQVSVYDD
jgi:hypothetical protein